jgi:hypothetical protein
MTPSTRSHQWEPEELLRLAERCEAAAADELASAFRDLKNNYPAERQRNAALQWLQIAAALRARASTPPEGHNG